MKNMVDTWSKVFKSQNKHLLKHNRQMYVLPNDHIHQRRNTKIK